MDYMDSEPISDIYEIVKPIFATLNPFYTELSSMQHQGQQK